MNYTTNYKLPQWVKEDRIQMEDFNEAMANIEDGFGDTLARLRRVGYDLYQTAARSICAGVSRGEMKGAVLNCLSNADEVSHSSGMVILDEGGAQLGPSTAITMEKLNAAVYSWESLEAPEVVEPAWTRVKFKSNFAGTITSLGVWYHRTSTGYINLPIYIRLYDLESNAYTYQSPKITGAKLSSATVTETLTVSIPVEVNRNYQLEVYTPGDAFYGTIGFGTYGAQTLTGTVSGSGLTNGTVTESLTLEDPVSQAVAVIHHSGGEVTQATVNGKTMTVSANRTGISLDGEACTEQELYLEETLSGTVELTADFQTAGQNMTVHDVEFFFI